MRDELETRADCYFWSKVLLATIAVLLSHLGFGLLNRGVTEGPNPSVYRWLSIRHLVSKFSAIATGHDAIHTLVSFPIRGLLWQLWLAYPLPMSVDCTQCLWVTEGPNPSVYRWLSIRHLVSKFSAIATGHDVIHTLVSFPIRGLLWQLWLSYPLHMSVGLYPMSCAPELRAE